MSSLSMNNNRKLPTTIRVDTTSSIGGTSNKIRNSDRMETSTTMASPTDIDKVIQGFQHELDTLSRSFDLMAASSHSRRSETKAHSNDQSYLGGNSTTTTPAPSQQRAPPPPPTARPQPTIDTESKSSTLNAHRADETFVSHTTGNTPLPRGVDTPVLSTTGRRRYADIPVSDDRNLFPTNSNNTDSNSLEATVQTLKEIMNQQSATILRLKRENNELRKKLDGGLPQRTTTARVEPMYESSNRPRYNHCADRNYDTRRYDYYSSSHQNEYYEDEMKPTVSSLTTIPREEEDENTLESTTRRVEHTAGFTPGTKFVAELSKFMTIHQGHSVPLSVIIDRHWDKLKYHMRDDANGDL